MTDSKEDKKRDEVLKRLLDTPPKPHAKPKNKKNEKGSADST